MYSRESEAGCCWRVRFRAVVLLELLSVNSRSGGALVGLGGDGGLRSRCILGRSAVVADRVLGKATVVLQVVDRGPSD